jgi:hypothetical protein
MTDLATPDGGHLALFLPSLAGGCAERIVPNLAAGFGAQGSSVDLMLAKAVGEYLQQGGRRFVEERLESNLIRYIRN